MAIITSFGDRPHWRARQAGKEFHIIFLVNPNRLAVRAIHARKRAVILIYFRTLASVRLEDDEVFASDITDIGLQFHEPDAAPIPVTFLPVVLQKFAIIESRAE